MFSTLRRQPRFAVVCALAALTVMSAGSASSSSGMTVPSEAIQTVDGNVVVLVQTSAGFKAVQVMVGRQASGRTEILRGLTGSERVASTNAFLLKAEMAKGEPSTATRDRQSCLKP